MIIFERDKHTGFERSIELNSRLFQDRCIFLVGPIERFICQEVVQQLMILDSQKHDDIYLYINSGGGEVNSGMSIISCIDDIKSCVNTICLGECASMAGVLLSSGHKRYIYKYGEVMLHSIKSMFHGHNADIQISAARSEKLNNKLMGILAKNCGYTLEEMHQLTEHDLWMDAQEALEFGIVDYTI